MLPMPETSGSPLATTTTARPAYDAISCAQPGPQRRRQVLAHLPGDLGHQRLHAWAGDEHVGRTDPLPGRLGQPGPAVGTDADDGHGRGEGLTQAGTRRLTLS